MTGTVTETGGDTGERTLPPTAKTKEEGKRMMRWTQWILVLIQTPQGVRGLVDFQSAMRQKQVQILQQQVHCFSSGRIPAPELCSELMLRTKFPRSDGDLKVEMTSFYFFVFSKYVGASKRNSCICHTLGSAVNKFLCDLCMTVNIKINKPQ